MKKFQVCEGYSVGNMFPLFILSMGYPFREGPTITLLPTHLFCMHFLISRTNLQGNESAKVEEPNFKMKIHILLMAPMMMPMKLLFVFEHY